MSTARHDGERFWVAEAVVEELTGGGAGTLDAGGRRVVGWGCGLLRGDWWFLSGLFVLPEAQGLGVGALLFELAGDGRAAAGGARHGHRLAAARVEHPVRAPWAAAARGPDRVRRTAAAGCASSLGTLEREPLTPPSIPELAEIDAAAGGLDRSRRPPLLPDRRRPLRLALPPARPPRRLRHLRQDGWIGPVAAVRERDMETVTAAAIADLASGRRREASRPASPPAAKARSGRSGGPGWCSTARPACSSPRGRSAASTATSPLATGCSERGFGWRLRLPPSGPRDTVR